MSTGSLRLFERKKMKALKVLELFNQGHSYREIANFLHMSLRDVSQFINLAADRTRTPSTTSIHDLIILEYKVNFLRSQLKDLELQKNNLDREVNDLRAQKYSAQIQLLAKQSELDTVKENLEYERFSKDILNEIRAQSIKSIKVTDKLNTTISTISCT